MIAFPTAIVKASSIPSDDALTENSLLSHERDPATDDAIAANAQVKAVFQTIRVAVARHLRDREAMKYRCFCEAATCEIAITTVKYVSHFARFLDSARREAHCITK